MEEECKNEIVQQLLLDGASVKVAFDHDKQSRHSSLEVIYGKSLEEIREENQLFRRLYMMSGPDLVVITDVFEETSETKQWLINYKIGGRQIGGAGSIFRDMTNLFLMTEWMPETLSGKRYTYIVDSGNEFEEVKKCFSEIKANCEVTCILYDSQNKKILDEVAAPLKSGKTCKTFYELLIKENEGRG